MLRKIVLVDIDHTISNAYPRDHMIGGDWDDYHAASVHDKPIMDIVLLLNALSKADFELVGITARPEKWRKLTLDWFIKYGITIDVILMRPDDAYHSSPELKMNLALKAFPNIKDKVAFILEDRDDVCAAFREAGITVLQVHARRD